MHDGHEHIVQHCSLQTIAKRGDQTDQSGCRQSKPPPRRYKCQRWRPKMEEMELQSTRRIDVHQPRPFVGGIVRRESEGESGGREINAPVCSIVNGSSSASFTTKTTHKLPLPRNRP